MRFSISNELLGEAGAYPWPTLGGKGQDDLEVLLWLHNGKTMIHQMECKERKVPHLIGHKKGLYYPVLEIQAMELGYR